MKKKFFIPLGIVTGLSVASASALSGCGGSASTSTSESTSSVGDAVDFGLDFIKSFFDRVSILKIDIPEDEKPDSDDTNEKKASEADEEKEEKKEEKKSAAESADNSPDKKSDVGSVITQNPLNTGVNAVSLSQAFPWRSSAVETPAIVRRGSSSVTPAATIRAVEAASVSTPVKAADAKESSLTEIMVDYKIPSQPDRRSETIQADNPVEKEVENTGESVIKVIPVASEQKEDQSRSFYREIFDHSKTLSYADLEGNTVCYVHIQGAVDTYEDGELVSTDGDDLTGTLEIHNLLTDEKLKFKPGELDDYNAYIHKLFKGDVVPEGKVPGASYSVYIEVYDNNETSSYADAEGNIICLLKKYGTVDTYENGVLVSSDGEEEAGKVEIKNLLTDEVFTFETGELSDYEDFVQEMFGGKADWRGSLIGPAYSYPEGEAPDDTEPPDIGYDDIEFDLEYSDDEDEYYEYDDGSYTLEDFDDEKNEPIDFEEDLTDQEVEYDSDAYDEAEAEDDDSDDDDFDEDDESDEDDEDGDSDEDDDDSDNDDDDDSDDGEDTDNDESED